MDMSKLPRLSQTNKDDAPTPVAADTVTAPPMAAKPAGEDVYEGRRYDPRHYDPGIGGEVWISIAVGAILLLMFRRLMQYVFHLLFGTYFAPYLMPDGTEVPYTSTPDFWSDLGITAFAFVLIFEGIALAIGRRRPGVILFALVLTVLATLYNLGFLIMTFSRGFPLISAFAVAFGVYIALYQWNLLKSMSRRPASA
ncbi:MAG TPA: hypothetical protein VGR35_20710 [Tepidisphaeraceae bacterium]|nr:hypothetical protein [Tepidisphaeraceae bacterium]